MERVPNATPEDLQRIKREAFDAVVKLGAAPENVEVMIEVDPQMQRVRATATGASEMRAQDLLKDVSEEQARVIAADSMGLPADTAKAAADQMRVFRARSKSAGSLVRVAARPCALVESGRRIWACSGATRWWSARVPVTDSTVAPRGSR